MMKQYLNQLLHITEQQNKVLFADDYEKFILLLEERQGIIDKIEEVNKIKSFTDEEKSILLEIKKLDGENTREFNRQLKEVKEELRKINQVKEKNMKYINPYEAFSRGLYFDKK